MNRLKLLRNDRKFIKELTIKARFFDGREIVVTFVRRRSRRSSEEK